MMRFITSFINKTIDVLFPRAVSKSVMFLNKNKLILSSMHSDKDFVIHSV